MGLCHSTTVTHKIHVKHRYAITLDPKSLQLPVPSTASPPLLTDSSALQHSVDKQKGEPIIKQKSKSRSKSPTSKSHSSIHSKSLSESARQVANEAERSKLKAQKKQKHEEKEKERAAKRQLIDQAKQELGGSNSSWALSAPSLAASSSSQLLVDDTELDDWQRDILDVMEEQSIQAYDMDISQGGTPGFERRYSNSMQSINWNGARMSPAPQPFSPSLTASNSSPHPTLLIVDEHPSTRSIISKWLSSSKFNEKICATGAQAQEVLKQHAEYLSEKRPALILPLQSATSQIDLIVCDVTVSVGDGQLLLDWVITHPQLSSIPVIVLSSNLPSQGLERLVRRGAWDVLHKPLNRTVFLNAIHNVFYSSKQKRLVEKLKAKGDEYKEQVFKQSSTRDVIPSSPSLLALNVSAPSLNSSVPPSPMSRSVVVQPILILLVETDPNIIASLTSWIESPSVKFKVVSTCAEAVKLLQESSRVAQLASSGISPNLPSSSIANRTSRSPTPSLTPEDAHRHIRAKSIDYLDRLKDSIFGIELVIVSHDLLAPPSLLSDTTTSADIPEEVQSSKDEEVDPTDNPSPTNAQHTRTTVFMSHGLSISQSLIDLTLSPIPGKKRVIPMVVVCDSDGLAPVSMALLKRAAVTVITKPLAPALVDKKLGLLLDTIQSNRQSILLARRASTYRNLLHQLGDEDDGNKLLSPPQSRAGARLLSQEREFRNNMSSPKLSRPLRLATSPRQRQHLVLPTGPPLSASQPTTPQHSTFNNNNNNNSTSNPSFQVLPNTEHPSSPKSASPVLKQSIRLRRSAHSAQLPFDSLELERGHHAPSSRTQVSFMNWQIHPPDEDEGRTTEAENEDVQSEQEHHSPVHHSITSERPSRFNEDEKSIKSSSNQ